MIKMVEQRVVFYPVAFFCCWAPGEQRVPPIHPPVELQRGEVNFTLSSIPFHSCPPWNAEIDCFNNQQNLHGSADPAGKCLPLQPPVPCLPTLSLLPCIQSLLDAAGQGFPLCEPKSDLCFCLARVLVRWFMFFTALKRSQYPKSQHRDSLVVNTVLGGCLDLVILEVCDSMVMEIVANRTRKDPQKLGFFPHVSKFSLCP